MDNSHFDIVIVGKGLMGSAAARYLSQSDKRIAIIGPDEPDNSDTHDGVFASHYDQGRLTRRLSGDLIWSQLAGRAIDQYRHIEAASGIPFYDPVGGIYVAPRDCDDAYLANVAAIGQQLNVAYTPCASADSLQNDHPFLRFPDNCHGLFEPAPAGYINPRDLIRAQLAIAQQQGATIVREMVLDVALSAESITLTTDGGRTFSAEKLLTTAGAFTNSHNLLPRKLDLRVKSETIIVARVDEREAERLQAMPTVIYQIESPAIDSIYLLPPIHYPDGHFYLKMGCNTVADLWLEDLAAMREWMINGASDLVSAEMSAALHSIIPDLRTDFVESRRCLVTYTPHGKPFIDTIVPGQLYVATGGNGSSAKCSDTLGWLAAHTTLEHAWPALFDSADFRVVSAG